MRPLAHRLARARAPGAPGALVEPARAALLAGVRAAPDADAAAADLASGTAAVRVGGTALARQAEGGAFDGAACAAGCAWCCVIGADGPPVTRAEALRVHAALAPLAGRAVPGTAWHPRACAALDPGTRTCRAYEARPLICRSFLSTDAAACEANAAGGAAAGAGVLSAQSLYLAALALVRSALRGTSKVSTYGLARVTSGALAGEGAPATLRAARQPDARLPEELRRLAPPRPRAPGHGPEGPPRL